MLTWQAAAGWEQHRLSLLIDRGLPPRSCFSYFIPPLSSAPPFPADRDQQREPCRGSAVGQGGPGTALPVRAWLHGQSRGAEAALVAWDAWGRARGRGGTAAAAAAAGAGARWPRAGGRAQHSGWLRKPIWRPSVLVVRAPARKGAALARQRCLAACTGCFLSLGCAPPPLPPPAAPTTSASGRTRPRRRPRPRSLSPPPLWARCSSSLVRLAAVGVADCVQGAAGEAGPARGSWTLLARYAACSSTATHTCPVQCGPVRLAGGRRACLLALGTRAACWTRPHAHSVARLLPRPFCPLFPLAVVVPMLQYWGYTSDK